MANIPRARLQDWQRELWDQNQRDAEALRWVTQNFNAQVVTSGPSMRDHQRIMIDRFADYIDRVEQDDEAPR